MIRKIGILNFGDGSVVRSAVGGFVFSLVACMIFSVAFCPVALAAGSIDNVTITSDGPVAGIDGVLGDAGPVITFDHTIGSDPNRILLVGAAAEGIGVAYDIVVTSVTYNGTAMTAAGSGVADNGPGLLGTLHYMLEADLPAAGTYSVVVTYSTGTISASVAAISVENFAQQAPEAMASGAAPDNTGTLSTDITTTTADAMLINLVGAGDFREFAGDMFTSNSGMTVQVSEEIGTQDAAIATKTIATPGLQSISWDYPTPNRMAQVIVALEALPSPPTATIARVGALDSAFVDTTGSWTVDFNEDVTGVVNGSFSLTKVDTADADPPTVSGGPMSYTVSIANVVGDGTLGLNFDPTGVASVLTGLAPVAQTNAAAFTNVVPAPAAKGWVLVFLGVVLALAAAAMLRKKTLNR